MEGLKITGIEVTAETCADIMATAVNAGVHGIGQWAYVRAALTGGESGRVILLRLTDVETGKKYNVDLDKVRQALAAMLMSPGSTNCEYLVGRIVSTQRADGPLADVIVQVACFGKVLYG